MTRCFHAALVKILTPVFPVLLLITGTVYSQPCTETGQTPSTALPVCRSTFSQTNIPRCQNNYLFIPNCNVRDNYTDYADRNAFWYRFTCSSPGTLGFTIDPNSAPGSETEDYDWQLWDITGRNPEDVYTDTTLTIAANWAGSLGETGTSASGVVGFMCASSYNRFSAMPTLIEGHDYLLMVSHFTSGKDGYTLAFNGGTAVINDSTKAQLVTAKPDCDNKVTVKLNKKLRCSTLSPTGSEFTLSPAGATVVAATSGSCSAGSFYLDEVILSLSNPLAEGNYELFVNMGDDGNTLVDDCGRAIQPGEKTSFRFNTTQPVFADSISHPGCAPEAVKIYFPKRINCSSVAADGSDFIVNGPSPVTVIGAVGDCTNGLSEVVTVRFSAPLNKNGDYVMTLKAGTDGTRIVDECDIEMPQQSLTFTAKETVSADFHYHNRLGCRFDTITFSHDGTHDVNSWKWIFNDSATVTTQNHTIVFPASSVNKVTLTVTNGFCSDTTARNVMLDNEVRADFDMPVEICPENPVMVSDKTSGSADIWQWSFGNIGSSDVANPPPQYFPRNNRESVYNIQLKVSNVSLGCSDSISKLLRVLNHCLIAVPSAFTPNNDGLNDLLYPNNALTAKDMEFKIFNRWGQLVFFTRNRQEKWNGKVNGIMQAPGVFVWYLKYTDAVTGQKVFQKGTTLLIR